jgi:L-ascorbate metabolism protein UlaG (beta-lactamase superfamily)
MVQVIPSKHSGGNAQKDDGVIINQPLTQPSKIKAYTEGGSFDFYIKHNGHSIYVKPSPNYIAGALDSIRADIVFIGTATVAGQPASWQDAYYEQTIGKLKPALVIPLHWDDFFEPVSDHLVMLPRMVKASEKDFDIFINRTNADKIDFRILQGTKSILLFK